MRSVRKDVYLHTYIRNVAASTSWNPQGLSRSVMGLLYLYLYRYIISSVLKTYTEMIRENIMTSIIISNIS